MSSLAAANNLHGTPAGTMRNPGVQLDEEAKIFLVGESAVAVVATIMAVASWLIATNYRTPWALWQSRLLMVVAVWPLYLIGKAWFSRLLGTPTNSSAFVENGFSAGD